MHSSDRKYLTENRLQVNPRNTALSPYMLGIMHLLLYLSIKYPYKASLVLFQHFWFAFFHGKVAMSFFSGYAFDDSVRHLTFFKSVHQNHQVCSFNLAINFL